ncbi:hypothetical protein CANCADRAFT_1112 [Tortispora caseinolytica NRRL Y-17796]|uniref:Uncharacterized protein n=1 Tax=Tortispora caseinolytica NRRL Y-17796 TaxID=767744 RepID=A0A1E4TLA5_9ASCO|nr:hypothetical protein CANCADRAFT_1112 [Tortispora caseinolytica NRRL Y-17796]
MSRALTILSNSQIPKRSICRSWVAEATIQEHIAGPTLGLLYKSRSSDTAPIWRNNSMALHSPILTSQLDDIDDPRTIDERVPPAKHVAFDSGREYSRSM